MRTYINPIKLLAGIAFLLLKITAVSQENIQKFIADNVQSSEYIVKGRIIDSESFWDINKLNIYTSYTLLPEEIFKGQLPNRITILVKGGKLLNTWQIVNTSPTLKIGDYGIFLLKNFNSTTISNEKEDWFIILNGRNGVLLIENKNILPVNLHELSSGKSANATHVIDSISPKVVTAGTGTLLNIYGSGFGEKVDTNRVWFTYSNLLYHIYSNDAFEYKSWTDNQIQIYVPTKAATGQIAIVKDGVQVLSEDSLLVKYACTTSIIGNPINLINLDNEGGYTWDLHTKLSNFPGSKELIIDAINEWVCSTSVPWKIGEETTLEPGNDGKCIISFGKIENSDIAMGETSLKATSQPTTGSDAWVLKDVDILLAEDKEYCFTGNCENSNKYDFKTIILHELAHALLIDHVNDPNDLMHCALDEGTIRNISANNIECADYILDFSEQLEHPEFKTITPNEFLEPVITVDGNILTSKYEFNQYQWYNQDGEIPNAINQTYTIDKSGEYYLVTKNDFGCEQITAAVSIILSSSNDVQNHNSLAIYPNPANNWITIEYKQNTYTELIVTNNYGQVVFNSIIEPGTNQKQINLEKLCPGMYFVNLKNLQESITKKLVVMN